jgi:hypothetical protein
MFDSAQESRPLRIFRACNYKRTEDGFESSLCHPMEFVGHLVEYPQGPLEGGETS